MRKKGLLLLSSSVIFDYEAFGLSLRNLRGDRSVSPLSHQDWEDIARMKEILKPRSCSISVARQVAESQDWELGIAGGSPVPSRFLREFGERPSLQQQLAQAGRFERVCVVADETEPIEWPPGRGERRWLKLRNAYRGAAAAPADQPDRLASLASLREVGDFAFLSLPIGASRVDFREDFRCPELDFWSGALALPRRVSLGPAAIVQGKKLGASLGIPTANLPLPQDFFQTSGLVPGIYAGSLEFLEVRTQAGNLDFAKGKSFPSIVSIGFNPQYNQTQPVAEAMILYDFGEAKFYESEVLISLEALMRPEAKFGTFEDFIFAMRNDVQAFKDSLAKKEDKS